MAGLSLTAANGATGLLPENPAKILVIVLIINFQAGMDCWAQDRTVEGFESACWSILLTVTECIEKY